MTARRQDARPPAGPSPVRLAHLVARLFVEVEQGRRPLAQLEPLLSPELYARLRTAGPRRRGRHRGPVSAGRAVLGLTLAAAGDDAYDAVAVVRREDRVGSLALRLERHRACWRVVELARPEDHGRAYRPPSITVRR